MLTKKQKGDISLFIHSFSYLSILLFYIAYNVFHNLFYHSLQIGTNPHDQVAQTRPTFTDDNRFSPAVICYFLSRTLFKVILPLKHFN